jgi:NAD(P)-dependent dehydrogenase (short-subunit alcohol dehydrogenase family)
LRCAITAATVAKVIDEGVAEFGRLDIVLANAGIMAITGEQRLHRKATRESTSC